MEDKPSRRYIIIRGDESYFIQDTVMGAYALRLLS